MAISILAARGIVLFIIAFLNVVLAIILWHASKKDRDSAKFWLGFTAVFSGFYAFFCGGTYFFWSQSEASIYWYRATWLGILLLPSFLMFAYYFTQKTQNLARSSKIKSVVLFAAGLVVIYFALTTDLFVKSVYLNGINISSLAGPLDAVGRLYIVLCSSMAIIILVKDYFTTSGFRKTQLKYFILGSAIFTVAGIISTSIVPFYLNESPYYDIAAYASFIWICLTAYAILKYKLMDIRLIVTQLLTFGLWAVLLLKIFSSNGVQEGIINSIIFVSVVFFGIFLIRSVIKEVQQKEEMEKMAGDVQRAYVVEKKAKEQLQELDTFKDHFLTQTQHDLRTPLTAIMGYTDMLQKGMFGKQTKKTQEVLQKIQVVSKNMKSKADSFLDLAQFQLGKSPVVLKAGVGMFSILDEVKSDLDFKAHLGGIYLDLKKPEQDLFITADREKLKAAIFNIVDNAVKYTSTGGVTITLKNHDSVKINITDTGIGLAKEKLDTIFGTMFERSEQAKKTALGAGIGLYLAAQIIKAHNGKIWVESEGEGKGSIFHIELPLSNEVNSNK